MSSMAGSVTGAVDCRGQDTKVENCVPKLLLMITKNRLALWI